MPNQRFRTSLLSICLLFLFTFAAACPVLAGGAASASNAGEAVISRAADSGTPDDDDQDDSSDSSSSDDNFYNGSGSLVVTGYRTAMWNPGWNPADPSDEWQDITTIQPGQRFILIVNFHDSRISKAYTQQRGNVMPRAKMNSGAFKPYAESQVFEAQGLSYKTDGYNFTVNFDVVYTGTGSNFSADIYYDDNKVTGIPYETFNLDIHNVVETTSDSDSDSDSGSVRGTSFALQSASYGEGTINAGAVFKLDVSMIATSGTYGLENVSATLTPDREITFATGTSTVYIGAVSPGQTVPLSFELQANAAAEDGSYKVTIAMHGINAKDGAESSTEVDISIPITQPDRLEISNVQVPDYVSTNENDGAGYASINLVNKGKAEVYNVSVAIEGEGITTQEGNQFLGTIAAGGQNTADFTVVGTEPGETNATVTVTYENVRGEEKTLTHMFSVTVADGGGDDMSDMIIDEFPEPEPEPGFPWVWVVVGAVVVAGVVVTILLVRRHKKKKAAELEDNEDDLDEDI